MFTTAEAMVRLRMKWKRDMRNLFPLLAPDHVAVIVGDDLADGRRENHRRQGEQQNGANDQQSCPGGLRPWQEHHHQPGEDAR
jgi:hypothetical protein